MWSWNDNTVFHSAWLNIMNLACMPNKYYFEWEMLGGIGKAQTELFSNQFRSWRSEFRDMFTRSPYISGKCITYLAVKSPRWKPLFAPTGVLLFVNRFSYKTWITENTTPVFVLFFGKGKHKSDACTEDVYLRLPSVTFRVVFLISPTTSTFICLLEVRVDSWVSLHWSSAF